MQKIRLLISDLDDTIWDWLGMWYKSFKPYISSIHELTGIELSNLKADFRALHQKYGTSEASFAYEELKTLTEDQKKQIDQNGDSTSILHQYYRDKKANLQLLDGVSDTLRELKNKRIKIVGFTESNSFYTKYRLKTLELDGVFDFIYTPKDHGIPESVKRYYPEDHWKPAITKLQILPGNSRKPNPKILLEIISDMGESISTTVYIGDKLDRDVHMANLAHVTSIHAQYGLKLESDAYQLLREVTHWTDEDVEREKNLKESMNGVEITPTYAVEKFSEILEKVKFEERE